MAEDKERGWTIITTTAAAQDWESRLPDVAIPQVEQLMVEQGSGLLQRTTEARRAVTEYLSRIELSQSFSSQVDKLRPNAAPEAVARAERLALGCFPDSEDIYSLAWLTIISFNKEIERTSGLYAEQNPYSNPELQSRVYLMVDRLFSSQPERFPTAFPLSRFGNGTKKMD